MKRECIDITSNEELAHSKFQISHRNNSTKLPKIKILGTGGTIASKGVSTTQTAGYQVDLTIEELINEIPDISSFCDIEYEQVFNIDSKEMDWNYLKLIYSKIRENIDDFDGIVITHGTDTLEETSFFLQLVFDIEKPIVICGSMRPSSAISCDGPMNLYQAIIIASSKKSIGRGILVALNDTIGSGFHITKSNANSLDTFKSLNEGFIGNFVNNEIHYYYPANKPMGAKYFNLNLPEFKVKEVLIFYAYQGFNNELIKLSVEHLDVAGIVLATMGAGSMSDTTNTVLHEIYSKYKIPIVYSKRAMSGSVPKAAMPYKIATEKAGSFAHFDGCIAGGYLNPQKCRILLQMCLSEGMDIVGIKNVFDGVYGG